MRSEKITFPSRFWKCAKFAWNLKSLISFFVLLNRIYAWHT